MKKYFVIAVALVTALVACSKSETRFEEFNGLKEEFHSFGMQHILFIAAIANESNNPPVRIETQKKKDGYKFIAKNKKGKKVKLTPAIETHLTDISNKRFSPEVNLEVQGVANFATFDLQEPMGKKRSQFSIVFDVLHKLEKREKIKIYQSCDEVTKASFKEDFACRFQATWLIRFEK